MFSREKLASAAKELADHLQVIEHIKSLQTGQKELADAIKLMGDRIRDLETDMRALKAEIKFEALKETQSIVNAVQGGLNQRIEDVAVRVALIERSPIKMQPATSIPVITHDTPLVDNNSPSRHDGA